MLHFTIDLPNALYFISRVSYCCPQLVPTNAFKTLFLLLTRLATCTQCLLNKKKVHTPSILGLWTRGNSELAIFIFGRVLACAGFRVSKVTDDFGVDINSVLARKNRYISVN